jgi:hypothetical protein
MKMLFAVSLVAPLMLLAISACEMAAEALPFAEANAEDDAGGYVTEFSALHSAIPASAVGDIDDYQ